jgi:anthranilate synthase/aminodeoxychorismate synthase-like glutamine amidotransferase
LILLFDNHDSFTYNLLDYFAQLGVSCIVVKNDEYTLEEISKLAFKAIVISPGPGKPKDAGMLMDLIAKYHAQVPILGVCLGHQALGEFFGAQLNSAEHIMHGKTSQLINTQLPMYEGMSLPFNVMRYHSLILSNIPECLLLTAETAAQEIMSFAHKDLPIWGLQFHPESILSENGLLIIRNWLQQNGLK